MISWKLKLGMASKKNQKQNPLRLKCTWVFEHGTKKISRSKFEMTWIFAELQTKIKLKLMIGVES